MTDDEWEGAKRNYVVRRNFQHRVLPPDRTARQLAAATTTEFFEAEVPKARGNGRPMWHAQPRCAVNLRQLLQTDTVEFRHWAGTLNAGLFQNAGLWCMLYLRGALFDPDTAPTALWNGMASSLLEFPPQHPYEHWKERRFRATTHDGSNRRDEILRNIAAIESGEFDDLPESVAPRRLPL